ncbi:multidrug efflux SMR transporter [Radiobacillus kanasensis]|uniref:DMT family transporter n=1 Tax=Radiobacillus kanasensis TaxID=2844358 RepID=UPI001E2EE1F4|nr:multidrug efflux SMR transporter [Radiobacillus kanasensis]UFT99755.1 multidrug efflux SMR transporter [Radiobacillus kanasensis]
MAYLYLFVAIITEIVGSSMLKMSEGFSKLLPSIGAIIGYSISFYLLSLTLKELPIGMTYAIWAGLGTALTAIIGILFWKEGFSLQTVVGIVAIILGVTVLNMPKWT